MDKEYYLIKHMVDDEEVHTTCHKYESHGDGLLSYFTIDENGAENETEIYEDDVVEIILL